MRCSWSDPTGPLSHGKMATELLQIATVCVPVLQCVTCEVTDSDTVCCSMQTPAEEACGDQSDLWSELNTVSSFDSGDIAGSTRPAGASEDGGMLVQNLKPLSGVSLLVESLIEQLCQLLESDPVLQKELYRAICGKLYSMKLVDETYGVEEFEFMRSHYQRALYHLLNVSKTVMDDTPSVLHVSSSPMLDVMSLANHNRLSWSRYHTDYQQLQFINKGGFGKVYKVRNKLDGEEYAVKKIWLRYHGVKSFLRKLGEVKMLARLNHPNIVSYKAAWLEPLDYAELAECSNKAGVPQYSLSTSGSGSETHEAAPSEDDSWSVEFKDSNSKSKNPSNTNISSDVGSNPSREDSAHSAIEETEVSSSQDVLVCKRLSKRTEVISVRHEAWAVLYIQMQLCDSTLGQWLAERNLSGEKSPVDIRQALGIFHQIVAGVQFIHARGIVHHDIKPSNIFVNADASQVQVGDFGLACCFQHSPDQVSLVSPDFPGAHDHTREVGTVPYAAPEQLQGRCDSKSDLYSLGIVLLELLQPCATHMERTKLISTLKTEHVLPAELENQEPRLAQITIRLTGSCVDDRPTATQLLDLLDEASRDVDAAGSNDGKDEVIDRLRQVVREKDDEIERLTTRIRHLEHYITLHKKNGLALD